MKDKKQTKGKTKVVNMIKSGKTLKIFSIKQEDLEIFAKEAKIYGIQYCALMNRKNKDLDGMVDIMVKDGLIEEVKSYYDKGIKTKPLMSGIGYKELYDYFDNKCTKEEALDKIKQNSRHYAKRQYTFFNNQLDVNWFNVDFEDFSKTIEEVSRFIEEEYK